MKYSKSRWWWVVAFVLSVSALSFLAEEIKKEKSMEHGPVLPSNNPWKML